MSALTFEQQRDLARRAEEAHRFAARSRQEEARTLTPEARWRKIETIQGFMELFRPPTPDSDPEKCGLVLQQRRFARVREAR